jgi:hypothetical protein
MACVAHGAIPHIPVDYLFGSIMGQSLVVMPLIPLF